ncbi:hypothetical protein K8942_04415 [Candidatus Peribacteria bacterium]|nr:MAG: hypothetical protein K8942_04415 [Candidatus Peribacteria bacterium]
MANQYFTFEELLAIDQFGSEEDGGFRVIPKNGHVRVAGSISGYVSVLPGGRIGFDEGHVWTASRPENDDPIRSFMALLLLPQEILIETGDVCYCPNEHERFVAGSFTESVGEHGMRIIHGGDAVAVIERSDIEPPYIVTLKVNQKGGKEREELLHWLREATLTEGYLRFHGHRMRKSYYLARSICLRSGISWNSQQICQEGKPFTSHTGQTYRVYAYRDIGFDGRRRDQAWIPHISVETNGYQNHLCLAEALRTMVLRDWATAVRALNVCNVCNKDTFVPLPDGGYCSDGCF